MTPDFSIVIPAYREELRLPPSMEKVQAWIASSGMAVEVIVVAEASPDRTQEVARELAGRYPNVRVLENEERLGKGKTVTRGVLAAKAPLVLFADADLSIPIEEASTLLARRDETGADVVVGRRRQELDLPLKRRVLSWGFRTLTKAITGIPLRETQCGFKLFTRDFVQDVFPLVDSVGWGFGFDVDVLAIGIARGWTATDAEVPVFHDERSTVDPVKDTWDMFRQLFRSRAAARKYARPGRRP